ncbi:MAG: hypothetical protein ABWW65_02485 [Thermoprotei archaeon]
MRVMHSIDIDVLKIVLKSIELVVRACILRDIKCYDPPFLTSPMLRHYFNYDDYAIKRFWRFFKDLGELSFPIYRHRYVAFVLKIVHVKELVCYERSNYIPLDPSICSSGEEYVKVPHSHALYMYIEGRLGKRVVVRMNIVRLLDLLYIKDKELPFKLLRILTGIIDGRYTISDLEKIVLDILQRCSNTLKYVLPVIPRNHEELVKLSPLIRVLALITRTT